MSKEKSFVELEIQFDDAMATMSSLCELMQNAQARSDYKHETLRRIGRGGLISTRKAEKAFHELMGLYLDEQQEIKRYKLEPKKPSSVPLISNRASSNVPLVRNTIKREPIIREPIIREPMIERAIHLISGTQTKSKRQ